MDATDPGEETDHAGIPATSRTALVPSGKRTSETACYIALFKLDQSEAEITEVWRFALLDVSNPDLKNVFPARAKRQAPVEILEHGILLALFQELLRQHHCWTREQYILLRFSV